MIPGWAICERPCHRQTGVPQGRIEVTLGTERYRLPVGGCLGHAVDGRVRSLANRLKTSARCAVMVAFAHPRAIKRQAAPRRARSLEPISHPDAVTVGPGQGTRRHRDCVPRDAPALCAIYNPYVTQTTVTFEEVAVSPRQMKRRIAEVTRRFPWIVCEQNGAVLGYAYATAWKSRSAYRHSVETTIYLDRNRTGEGIGTELYRTLLARLRAQDVHSVVGGIALPNAASVALHEKLGFLKVAQFRQIGLKFGQRIDVGYWQLTLS